MLELMRLPDKEYFAIDALSSSGIKQLLKSPRHYKQMLAQSNDPTPSMRVGTLVHRLVLGEDLLDIAVFEGKSLNSKAADVFIAEHPGMVVVTQGELDEAQTIMDAQAGKPILDIFSETENEIAIVGELEGVKVKAKADALYRKLGMIIDVKTCASIEMFKKNFFNYGYHIQEAWYTRLYSLLLPIHDFVFWAVETSPPYDSMCFRVSPELHEHAVDKITAALATYHECVTKDIWRGYTDEIQEIGLPLWLK